MVRTWEWVVAVLAALAVFTLPALQLSAPLVPARSWTIAELAASAARASGRHRPGQGDAGLAARLRQARDLLQAVTGKRHSSGLERALGWAAAIPLAALLAGACALLSLLAVGVAWRRVQRWVAGIGLAAAAYTVGASWWLTHQAHALLAQWIGPSTLVGQFALQPEAAAYVLVLLFAAMLLWPAPAV